MDQIENYINRFSAEAQKPLRKLRSIIKLSAPQADETINYQMPTFKLHGNLVHFAGYKNHIGFYPTPSAIVQFKKELSAYVTSKGAVQFPLSEPLPEKLITQMVQFRVKENIEKAKQKTAKKCTKGHTFYKTSDCPVCPICEQEKKKNIGPWSNLSAPAQRALHLAGINTLEKLSNYSEKEILQLHGLGPSSIPKLKAELKTQKLSFKK